MRKHGKMKLHSAQVLSKLSASTRGNQRNSKARGVVCFFSVFDPVIPQSKACEYHI